MYELQIYRGVIFMTMKNDANFEKELNCQFKTDMRNLKRLDQSTQKSQNCAL